MYIEDLLISISGGAGIDHRAPFLRVRPRMGFVSTRTHAGAIWSASAKAAGRRCVRIAGGEETRRRGRYGFLARDVLYDDSADNHVEASRTDSNDNVAPVRAATADTPREPQCERGRPEKAMVCVRRRGGRSTSQKTLIAATFSSKGRRTMNELWSSRLWFLMFQISPNCFRT